MFEEPSLGSMPPSVLGGLLADQQLGGHSLDWELCFHLLLECLRGLEPFGLTQTHCHGLPWQASHLQSGPHLHAQSCEGLWPSG